MENKVGRNDPCPCGSGKKYKNCCMGKKEESKKTYTAAGKRKFKAKVLSSTDMRSQSLFSGSASQAPAEAPSFDVLKVRLAKTDYRVKEEDAEKTPLPFVIPGPESAQQPSSPSTTSQEPLKLPEGEFKPATEDFRKKKKEGNE